MNDQPPAPNGDLGPVTPREIAFPGNELALAVAIGLPALLVAASCTLLLISYLGPQFDVVIMNDHVIGGTSDQLFLIFIGFCLWSRRSVLRAQVLAPLSRVAAGAGH